MNIIKSNLVSAAYDPLWDDVTDLVKDAAPKPVLILVHEHDNIAAEAQLLKMLEACKLVPYQYNIVQLGKDRKAAWHKLQELLDPRIVFLVGVHPSQLGISSLFRLNAPNHFNDRVWLPTVSLSELEQRPDMKKQLWTEGMKPVFVDKPLPE